MRKELRPVHDDVSCQVCGRTILKGERAEAYLAPGGERKRVCDLCSARASGEGWIRESAHGDLPVAGRHAEPRRPLWARFARRGRDETGALGLERPEAEPGPGGEGSPAPASEFAASDPNGRRAEPAGPPVEGGLGSAPWAGATPAPPGGFADAPPPPPSNGFPEAAAGARRASPAGPLSNGSSDALEEVSPTPTGEAASGRTPQAGRSHDGPPGAARPPFQGGLRERLGGGRRKDSRHVRAVPTNAQVKVQRALELFNQSEHRRTIAGIGRSLGEPWVSAVPLETAPSEVVIVVAWELSWYRYRVDLGDADQPILLLEKGEELDQLDGAPRDWNVAAGPDGRLALPVGSSE